MKRGFLLIFLASFLLVIGCDSTEQTTTTTLTEPITEETTTTLEETTTTVLEAKENIIEVTSNGFVPDSLIIKKGEKITWINKMAESSWPASNIHPSHTVYPGSDVKKCKTSEKESIFDACKGLKENENYSFIFEETGKWDYHDHLNSDVTGIVIVE